MLVPRGFDAPLELVEGMRERGVVLEEVGDAPAVMTALARERYLSLVIVEPRAVLELTELLEATQHYHPAVPVWQYVTEQRPRLTRLREARRQATPPPPPDSSHEEQDDAVARPEPQHSAAVAGRIRPTQQPLAGQPDEPSFDEPKPGITRPAMTEPGLNGSAIEEPDSPATDKPTDDQPAQRPEINVTLTEAELAMLLGSGDQTGAPAEGDEQEKRR